MPLMEQVNRERTLGAWVVQMQNWMHAGRIQGRNRPIGVLNSEIARGAKVMLECILAIDSDLMGTPELMDYPGRHWIIYTMINEKKVGVSFDFSTRNDSFAVWIQDMETNRAVNNSYASCIVSDLRNPAEPIRLSAALIGHLGIRTVLSTVQEPILDLTGIVDAVYRMDVRG